MSQTQFPPTTAVSKDTRKVQPFGNGKHFQFLALTSQKQQSLLEVHTQTDPLSATPLTVGTAVFSPMLWKEKPFYSIQDAVTESLNSETVLFKAHNNRTKTLQLELCVHFLNGYKNYFLLLLYAMMQHYLNVNYE